MAQQRRMSNQSNGAANPRQNLIEIWEPTYRMAPTDEERFVPQDVEKIIKEVMEKHLRKATYEDAPCKLTSLNLCTEIKEKVKELNIPRYKLILQCVIGELKGQGAFVSSRCLWDTDTDNYASYSLKNSSLFCTVLVFGLYLI